MDFFFNVDELARLIFKIERFENLAPEEHHFVQKIIAAQTLIFQYKKNFGENKYIFENMCSSYYKWICSHWQRKTKREQTDLFLLKNSLEKVDFYHFKKYKKPLNQYDVLKILSDIWGHPLEKTRHSIISFLSFFMNEIYDIPKKNIESIFFLIESDWKTVLPPLGGFSHKKYSLDELKEYFFGQKETPFFKAHVLEKIDRYFSVLGGGSENHIFLPQKEDFDLFEAALVIHEFQHIKDFWDFDEKKMGHELGFKESLFFLEKRALSAERAFLFGTGSLKRTKYYWLESNLFYPIIMLRYEFHQLLFGENNDINFSKLCQSHGLEPLVLSSLFDWGAPFQMSVYCAAAMDLDKNWLKFIR